MNEEKQPEVENKDQQDTVDLGGEKSTEEEKSTGAIIGAIIIVVLLIMGGLYFFGQRTVTKELAPEEILSQPDVVVETLQKQGNSDAIDDITKDLGTPADFGNLDVELGNIDATLNQ